MEPFHCTDGYFEKGSLDYKMLYFITLKMVILYFYRVLVTLCHPGPQNPIHGYIFWKFDIHHMKADR